MTEERPQERFTFGKEEKLCSQKAIEYLFKKGDSFIAYPLRVVYLKKTEEDKLLPKILISVSKRKFKRANKRNRVKRLIREAYRLNNLPLITFCKEQKISADIAFLYLKDELPTYLEIEKAVKKTIQVICNKK